MFKTQKVADGSVKWELQCDFAKKLEDRHLVYGVVYEPDVVDAQDDSASAEEIEKAAHNFMKRSRRVKIQHREDADGRAVIVQSYIAAENFRIGDQIIRKGSWVMVVEIDDEELWQQVQKGELTGFSMGGRARAA